MATRADPHEPRFVFLLGTGRCGSSLVHEVLARHPDIGFLSNVDDRIGSSPISRWNSVIYRRVPPALTRKGRIRFAPSEGYRALDREVSPAISAPVRDLLANDATPWLAGRFRGFFQERGRQQGAPVFMHKFTGWPRARFIRAALPEARFVHIVRDGRAVANSLVQMPWWRGYLGPDRWGWGPLPEAYEKAWEASARSFPVLAALEWRLLIEAFEETQAEISGDRWLQIRYEDFLTDPRASVDALLGFAGLPWTPAFDRSFVQYRFDASRVTSFVRELRAQDLAAIEVSIGEALAVWGYRTPSDVDTVLGSPGPVGRDDLGRKQ
jgi:hypothetical protein